MHQENICSNCNSELTDIYCSKCGQKNVGLLTFRVIINDFLDNIFSIDSRLFVTLKYLIFKPGYLTTEYWAGKRKKYLPPFRLYLVLSVIYFLLTPMLRNGHYITSKEIPLSQKGRALIHVNEYPDRVQGLVWFEFTPEEIQNSNLIKYFHTGILIAEKRDMTLEGIMYSNLPTAMFILMPFMAVIFLQILYRKKKLLYSHHLITILHLHAFIFLMFTLSNIFIAFIPDYWSSFSLFFNIIFIIYIYLLMKNVYINSWLKTLGKFILLMVTYSLTLILTVTATFIINIILLGYFS
jgi:hypothetical protein